MPAVWSQKPSKVTFMEAITFRIGTCVEVLNLLFFQVVACEANLVKGGERWQV